MSDGIKIFLSHAYEEYELAAHLKAFLRHADVLTVAAHVFCSSDDVSLTPGDPWREQVRNQIVVSDIVLLLTGRRTAREHPWLMFEGGAAWGRKIPIVPILHTEAEETDLPGPIAWPSAVRLDSSGLTSLTRKLRDLANLSPPNTSSLETAIESFAKDTGLRELRDDLPRVDGSSPAYTWPTSGCPQAQAALLDALRKSSEIRVLSMGCGLLFSANARQELEEQVRGGARLHVTLLDPESDEFRNRIAKENKYQNVGAVTDVHRFLQQLALDVRQPNPQADPDVDFRLHQNSPLYSLYRFDDHVFFHTYGYGLSGDLCPLVLLPGAWGPHGGFFPSQWSRVWDSSESA